MSPPSIVFLRTHIPTKEGSQFPATLLSVKEYIDKMIYTICVRLLSCCSLLRFMGLTP